MKVSGLKRMIRQRVSERVAQLKEQFEHIEPKKTGSVQGEKPTTPEGADSGDKKMGPVRGQPPVSVSNAVDKVKDEKGRMNEAAAVEPVANTMAKVGEQKGAMNEAPVANPGVKTVANARGTPAEQKSQARLLGKMARAQKNEAPAPAAPVMAQDVAVEVPLPAGAEGATVTAQVEPNEQGEGAVAELIIVDDELAPEAIAEDEIVIEIPDEAAEAMGDPQHPEDVPSVQVPEEGAPRPEGQDEFDRFADLAGVK